MLKIKKFESLHTKINFLNFLRVEFTFSLKLKQMSIVSSSQNRLETGNIPLHKSKYIMVNLAFLVRTVSCLGVRKNVCQPPLSILSFDPPLFGKKNSTAERAVWKKWEKIFFDLCIFSYFICLS